MRFGIVGLGRAARVYHVPALRGVAGAVLAGGTDSSAEQRASWEAETSSPAFESLDELLERGRPDAVLVATPPDAHREPCLAALAHGAHVFCEKPFMANVADAEQVLAAAASAGRQVAVNHEYRETPIFRSVAEAIDSGRFGRLVFAQLWQLMNLAPWQDETPWRAGMADRTLLEGGVHLVDLLVMFFGEAPHAVYASSSAGYHEQSDADAISLVTLEFSDGRLGQITIDRLCPSATRYLEVRADCEEASLRASFGGRANVRVGLKRAEKPGVRLDFGLSGLAWTERGTSRTTLARNPRNAAVLATQRLLQRFSDAIERGEEPPSSGREARDVLAVIEAAYESSRSGTRVEVAAASPAV